METFKKRQKAMARQEKQRKKAARGVERKSERAGAEKKPQGENSQMAESSSAPEPKAL